MSNFNFPIISFNVRGLRDYKKNRKLFNWLTKHGSEEGVVFLQETHSSIDVENAWSRRVRGELIMSHGTSKSRGTSILFGNKLDYKIKDKQIDQNGRFVIVLVGLNIKQKDVKMLIFADDTTFFLKDEFSFQQVLKVLNNFAEFSSLKINSNTMEITRVVNVRLNFCLGFCTT